MQLLSETSSEIPVMHHVIGESFRTSPVLVGAGRLRPLSEYMCSSACLWGNAADSLPVCWKNPQKTTPKIKCLSKRSALRRWNLWERRPPTTLSFKGCQELQELRRGRLLVLKAGVGQDAGAPLKADRCEMSSHLSDTPSPAVPAAVLLGKKTPTDRQVASCSCPHKKL